MATLNNHVTITITRDTVGITRAGFGTTLLLSPYAAFAERVRTYASLAEVAEDFAVTTSPEYLAATVYFSQNPKPTALKIGRQALKHTQVVTGGVTTIRNSHTYSLTVRGKGITTTTVTYTSDASATAAEIVTGLVTAMNLVSGNNYTAAVVGDTFTVTADTAGDCFSIEVLARADLYAAQTHVDAGVATDLAAILLEDADWFGLYTFQNSNAVFLASAAWCEANEKLYLGDSADTACVTGTVGSSDSLDDVATLEYAYTLGSFHPDSFSMFGAGWSGRVLPIEPGGDTWKWKTVIGVEPVTLSSTERTNLINKNGNSYERIAGRNITFEGTTADGDYADVTRGLAWFKNDAQSEIFGTLAGADKIPYTEPGIAVLKNDYWGSVTRGVTRGLFVGDEDEDIQRRPLVTSTPISQLSTGDRTARRVYLAANATIAGAVHKVSMTANVTV